LRAKKRELQKKYQGDEESNEKKTPKTTMLPFQKDCVLEDFTHLGDKNQNIVHEKTAAYLIKPL
jgi:hypothetical protein